MADEMVQTGTGEIILKSQSPTRFAKPAPAPLVKPGASQQQGSEAQCSGAPAEGETHEQPATKEKPNYDIDPDLADPWDLTDEQRAARAAEEPQGFDRFRQQSTGHSLSPDALTGNVRVDANEAHAAVADVGIAARRDGISAEGAQAMIDMIAPTYQPPKNAFGDAGNEITGEFDFEAGRASLYGLAGEKAAEVLADIHAWVSKRPAVAAYLDEGVVLGNHPAVLAALAGISQAAKQGMDITTVKGAKLYVARMLGDMSSPYWQGSKVHVAGVQYAMSVEAAAEKRATRKR